MIDTDKYEGHIPGPWKLKGKIKIDKEFIATGFLALGGKAKGSMLHTIDTQPSKCGCTDVNAQLMTDTPLLLAEVKRLREALITMRDECNDFNDLGKRLHDFMRKEMIE